MQQIVLCLFMIVYSSLAFANSRVEADLKKFDNQVTTMNAAFEKTSPSPKDKEWVKKKLQHMVDVDQYMRNSMNIPFKNKYSETEKEEFQSKFKEYFNSVDTKNTAELKELLKIYQWFTISSFGKEADSNAWLLTQHADLDIEFQKTVLKILEDLFPKGETNPAHYAYLYDRVASSFNDPSKRKPQKYGTQGNCTGPGLWVPNPIEDPEQLDERRKSVGLESEAEYILRFKTICH